MSVYRILLIAAVFVTSYSFSQEIKVELKSLTCNTDANEFAIRKFNNAFVFVGVAKDDLGNPTFDPKTNEPFTDLYVYDFDTVVPFEIKNQEGVLLLASSHYFDGPMSASENGELIFFTNNINGKRDKQTLGIFYTMKTVLGYSDPVSFSFNSEEYNTTHPYFDEKTGYLYFASDISTGKGGMDIYRAKWENQTLTSIDTLSVNSSSNDVFPTIYNGNLYFSSDRESSFLGYNLYKEENNTTSELAAPFNSNADDIDIYWFNDTAGFISSNRALDENQELLTPDNIYSFTVKETQRVVSIDIELVDAEGNPIDAALITVTEDATGVIKFSALTDAFGKIEGTIDTLARNEANGYTISIDKEGFIFQEQKLTANAEDTSSLNINSATIDPKPRELESEMELSKALDISTIYYDLNSSMLRESAKIELDKLVTFMNKHPEVSVELGSHTDCIGSSKYNLWLSERRAASAAQYVKDRIKVPVQLISKGYGENFPVGECDCSGGDSSCSDDDNQKNRRTEFKITALNFSSK